MGASFISPTRFLAHGTPTKETNSTKKGQARSARIEAALRTLQDEGKVRQETRQTGGRPATIWRII